MADINEERERLRALQPAVPSPAERAAKSLSLSLWPRAPARSSRSAILDLPPAKISKREPMIAQRRFAEGSSQRRNDVKIS